MTMSEWARLLQGNTLYGLVSVNKGLILSCCTSCPSQSGQGVAITPPSGSSPVTVAGQREVVNNTLCLEQSFPNLNAHLNHLGISLDAHWIQEAWEGPEILHF